MTPEEVGARFGQLLGEDAAAEVAYGGVTVSVPAPRWVQTVALAKSTPGLDFTFFDWLSAVDELEEGFSVFLHLWAPVHRHHVLLRTRTPRATPQLPTITAVFPGATWHERETWEMFGVVFEGHPQLVPLLLPEGFEGHPLRKEFVLASRVAKVWPGAKEPGESHGDAPGRRRMPPLGIPDPDVWGPQAKRDPTADAGSAS